MNIFAAALLCLSTSAIAQESAPEQEPAPAQQKETTASTIAWYGTWEQGLAEAKRLDLPIILHSAAPRCGGVPGMW
jgi:hypothetical protein